MAASIIPAGAGKTDDFRDQCPLNPIIPACAGLPLTGNSWPCGRWHRIRLTTSDKLWGAMLVPSFLAVGQPYYAGRTTWPEGTEYNYRSGAHELRLFWRSPTAAEIRGVRRGEMDIGLLVDGPIIWFLYRFRGACDWSDASYSVWRVSPEERHEPPQTGPNEWALLLVVLVDAATGLVRALRQVSMSPALTQALHTAIRAQMATPCPDAEYQAAVAAGYQRYADTAAMVKAAVITERAGL